MNELQTLVDDERMTSLQIAEVTGKRHSDIMRAIRNMEPAWEKVQERKFALMQTEVATNNGGHKLQPYYSLTKEECLYIATKFNDEARAKLVRRWKELEEEHRIPNVPRTYLEALRSLVKAEEEREQLLLENHKQAQEIESMIKANVELGDKITEMLPKVSYYDQILQSNATVTVTQIAQDYGMSAQRLNKELADMKIQHKVRSQWILYRQYVTGGYVHSRPVEITRNDGKIDVKYNTEWTTKGRLFIYEALKGKGILPLIEQPSAAAKDTGQPKADKQTTINFN